MPALRLFAAGALLCLLAQPAQQSALVSAGTIRIDVAREGHAIPTSMYGIFFEEISHAGDGGL